MLLTLSGLALLFYFQAPCFCPHGWMSKPSPKDSRHVGIILGAIVVTMLAMAYAAVPLYKIFCQKTGYGGTPKIAVAASTKTVGNRLITVRFTASTHRDLPWNFRPLQTSIVVKAGQNGLAFYEATNDADYPIVGMATYNVTPDRAGTYFNKIACFCFEEQLLKPGQTMDMPVQFFIDPEFADDPEMADIDTITLSYTFFVLKK